MIRSFVVQSESAIVLPHANATVVAYNMRRMLPVHIVAARHHRQEYHIFDIALLTRARLRTVKHRVKVSFPLMKTISPSIEASSVEVARQYARDGTDRVRISFKQLH